MNRTPLLLGLTLLSCPMISAQPGHAFNSPDSRWNVAETSSANVQAFLETWTITYGIVDDTLFNGDTWLRIASSTDPDMTGPLVQEGFVREVGPLVLHRAGAQIDTLYNFDRLAGDTVHYEIDGSPAFLLITSVDTVLINGEARKRFHFAQYEGGFCYLADEQWIEGIGSLRGPLFPLQATTFCEEFHESLHLACYWEGTEMIWANPEVDECVTDILLSTSEGSSLKLHIHPNPASTSIRVSGLPGGSTSYVLMDAMGRAVLHSSLQGAQGTLLLPQLAPGLYHLQLCLPDYSMQSARVVVE